MSRLPIPPIRRSHPGDDQVRVIVRDEFEAIVGDLPMPNFLTLRIRDLVGSAERIVDEDRVLRALLNTPIADLVTNRARLIEALPEEILQPRVIDVVSRIDVSPVFVVRRMRQREERTHLSLLYGPPVFFTEFDDLPVCGCVFHVRIRDHLARTPGLKDGNAQQ